MTRKFTTTARQAILDEFVARHGGYDPKVFLDEVRLSNGGHPAHAWFTWQDHVAADAHRLHEARTFVQGLRVKFDVITTTRGVRAVTVREAPAYLSPVAGRKAGGGYFATDPNDDTHMAELRQQAATALGSWLSRFGSTLDVADDRALRRVIDKLSATEAAVA